MTDPEAQHQRIPAVEHPTANSPLLRVLANNERLYDLIRTQTEVLVAGSALPVRVRWLITIRMSWRCHGEYALARHGANAPEPGLLEIATGPADAAGLAEDDALVLSLVDQLHGKQDVDDELFAALAARWSRSELLELLAISSVYWQAAVFANVAGVRWVPRAEDARTH